MTQTLTERPTEHQAPWWWPDGLAEPSDLQASVHDHHQHTRRAIISALWETPHQTLKRRASTINDCARTVTLFLHAFTGTAQRYTCRCHDRLCPYCSHQRQTRTKVRLSHVISHMTSPKHLVLTIPSQTTPLGETISNLLNTFHKLRKTPLWRNANPSGLYVLEITRNPTTGLWHPHIHAVLDSRFIPIAPLRRLWAQIWPGTEVVWIEKIRTVPQLAAELSKYVGKPPNIRDWPNRAITEYALATARRHLIQPFGPKPPQTASDDDPNQIDIGEHRHVSLSRICHDAANGDTSAQDASWAAAKLWPDIARYIHHRVPATKDQDRLATQPHVSWASLVCQAEIRSPGYAARDPTALLHQALTMSLGNYLNTHRTGTVQDDNGDLCRDMD